MYIYIYIDLISTNRVQLNRHVFVPDKIICFGTNLLLNAKLIRMLNFSNENSDILRCFYSLAKKVCR